MTGSVKEQQDDLCCKPALMALGKDPDSKDTKCGECPFPFCLRHEARTAISALRAQSIILMSSVQHMAQGQIASMVGLSTRQVQRVVSNADNCRWCAVDAKITGVFCRSNVCTVAYDRETIAVSLAVHRTASNFEVKLVNALVEGIFPNGVLNAHSTNGNPHSGWNISNVSKDESAEAFSKMENLSMFTTELR